MKRKAPEAPDPAILLWCNPWRVCKRGNQHYIMSGKHEVCRIAPGLHKDVARIIRSAPDMREELDALVHFISDNMPGLVNGILSNKQD